MFKCLEGRSQTAEVNLVEISIMRPRAPTTQPSHSWSPPITGCRDSCKTSCGQSAEGSESSSCRVRARSASMPQSSKNTPRTGSGVCTPKARRPRKSCGRHERQFVKPGTFRLAFGGAAGIPDKILSRATNSQERLLPRQGSSRAVRAATPGGGLRSAQAVGFDSAIWIKCSSKINVCIGK